MRILVIEDEEKIAHFIIRGLKEEGYSVDTSYDGEKGIFLPCPRNTICHSTRGGIVVLYPMTHLSGYLEHFPYVGLFCSPDYGRNRPPFP